MFMTLYKGLCEVYDFDGDDRCGGNTRIRDCGEVEVK